MKDNDFLTSTKDYLVNGGMFGYMRGYNHKECGRPYGLREFNEDCKLLEIAVGAVAGVLVAVAIIKSKNLIT